MKALVILVIVIVLFVLALIVGAQNDQVVLAHYLIGQVQLRLSWLMALMFLFGFIVACLGFGFFYTKTRFQVGQLRRQLRKQQRELYKFQSKPNGD
ncbi:LapA family protein [Celerinatantimonas yamalensis]|uniref:Probable lipopolysaccharide assembly protein A n=1 Tax=Celerinatantimonas yamalensis TaxID=559956 RepID=A0ABW9G284_9GAMM